MSQQKTAVLIALSIGALATFMPWVGNGLVSLPGSKGDGWISFAFYLAGILTLLAGGKTTKILNTINGNLIIYLAISGLLFGVWKVLDLQSRSVTIEFGLYLSIISGFFVPVIVFFTREDTEPLAKFINMVALSVAAFIVMLILPLVIYYKDIMQWCFFIILFVLGLLFFVPVKQKK